jgi:hypothetical protein
VAPAEHATLPLRPHPVNFSAPTGAGDMRDG